MIFRFENWYADTFEMGPIGTSQPIVMEPSEQGEKKGAVLSAGDQASSSARDGFGNQDLFEDEDAATYRRAKAAVDELHRARKFEKSIKIK